MCSISRGKLFFVMLDLFQHPIKSTSRETLNLFQDQGDKIGFFGDLVIKK